MDRRPRNIWVSVTIALNSMTNERAMGTHLAVQLPQTPCIIAAFSCAPFE